MRTPERESLFQWVGPISKRRIYLYKSSRRTDISLAYIEDAKRFQIGAVQESAAVKTLLKRGFQIGKELDLAIDDDKNMRKFKAGRFDLLLSLDWAAMYNAKQNNMSVDELEPAILVDDSSEYWFGISLETSPQIVAQLNGALLQVKKTAVDRLDPALSAREQNPLNLAGQGLVWLSGLQRIIFVRTRRQLLHSKPNQSLPSANSSFRSAWQCGSPCRLKALGVTPSRV